MESMSLALASYGPRPKSPRWWIGFLDAAERLAVMRGWTYTDVGVSVAGKRPGQTLDKNWRYSGKALQKAKDTLGQEQPLAVGFAIQGPGGEHNVGALLELGMNVDALGPPCNLVLTFDMDMLKGRHAAMTTKALVETFEEVEGVIRQTYGLVHRMERRKGPGLFLAGIGTNHLSEPENELLARWVSSGTQYEDKLWDIYWGNLVSETQGGPRHEDLVQAFRDHVGEEHVMPFGEGRHFITLPFDLADAAHYEENLARWRRRLRRVPVIRDALM